MGDRSSLVDFKNAVKKENYLMVIESTKLYNDYWNLPFFHKKEVEKMVAKRLVRLILIIALLAASFAFTRPVSAGSGCGSTYVVQPGDWLAKIAANCGITLAALYAANPWAAYYYYIYPGQLLTIPGSYSGGGGYSGNSYCGPAYSAYYGNYYVVCYGDTLSGIAWYYGESLAYVQWHNGISNPNLIYSGQFIWP